MPTDFPHESAIAIAVTHMKDNISIFNMNSSKHLLLWKMTLKWITLYNLLIHKYWAEYISDIVKNFRKMIDFD